MKDTRFLTHDCNARNDPKLLKVQMVMGGEGIGLYWCIVEMLWENEGYLPLDYDILAFNLRWASPEKVRSLVEDYGLFENDGSRFWSNSALDRIRKTKEVKQSRSDAGRKGNEVRWGGNSGNIPEQSQCDSDAIPEQSQVIALPTYLSTYQNKNKSFSFSFEKGDEHEMLVAYFTFLKNVPSPNKEVEKFLAFNNTDGRCWDDMPEKARSRAFNSWEQKPARRPRFEHDFLLGWAKVCDALMASGAPQRIRMAALADGVKYDAIKEKYILWIPDVLRDWIENHIQEVGSVLMREIVQPAGHSALCYRKCAESAKP